ncbi:hypothetical protein OSTOST_10326, partial [Ostertagia ostertagi]
LSVAVRALLHSFEWDQFAVIYSDYGSIDTACSTMKSDIENVLSTVAINYVGHLPDISFESVKRTMEQIKERARIIVFCVPDVSIRDFMLNLMDGGYMTNEYVFISANVKSKGFTVPEVGGKERYLWEDTERNDGRDDEAKEAFMHLFVITDASQYAGHLYEALYVYAVALNRTLDLNPQIGTLRDGLVIMGNVMMEFESFSEKVVIGPNHSRYPSFYFDSLDSNYEVETYGMTYKPLYTVETQLWWRRGQRPLAVPKCGFSGLEVDIAMFLMTPSSIGARRLERERQNMMWRIPFSSLEPIEKRKRDTSSRSLQSGVVTIDSARRGSLANSRNYTFYVHEQLTSTNQNFKLERETAYIGVRVLLIFTNPPSIFTAFSNRKNCLVGDHWDVKISDFGLNRVELCDKLIAEGALNHENKADKSSIRGRDKNLMDYVFHIMENYASSLEDEVEERTKELVEEKKKSDLLLYRMLPQ